MKYMSGNDIRSEFLKYFEKHGHTVVASSSLVPYEDPTLLFTNAGMNQFKDVFLGKATRSYTKATTCQKVVRAGGKHNDLENVGRTARHHTFFEMLGNFSFGNYFKKEAISYAWDFLTNVLELPVDKLFVTVYKDDDEAFNLWRDMIGLAESKILRRGEEDNFWQMGDTGPCGPCSEIFIDRGPEAGCKSPDCNPDCECDRHLEIWNLVFMQYNRDESGMLHPLPKPSIDTGMGLERVASIVQNVPTNYDTDLLLPIIKFIADLAGIKYLLSDDTDVSLKVIADHARSATFLISDGVLPSNEGRGYVLRRIMRRAMRHGNKLEIPEAFFYKVCAFVVDFMKGHYMELADKKVYIEKVVQVEEESFSRTLNTGLKLTLELFDTLPPKSVIDGETIFKLYDTHGFPLDLLQEIVEEAGYSLDMDGFNKFLQQQQEKAKKGGLGLSASNVADILVTLGSTTATVFDGYDPALCESEIKILVAGDKEVKSVNGSVNGGEVDIITDCTVFYPEGGGQVGDTGTISTHKCHVKVKNTIKVGDMIVHRGVVVSGEIHVGDKAVLKIDIEKRRAVEKNHTATHLLHKALKQTLGEHARQAGSYVTADALRFDFTHFGALDKAELKLITEMVNTAIGENLVVTKIYTTHEDALKQGAVALFGEKYGDNVRMVEIGADFSRELCGGCHVHTTSEINAFVVTSVGSVAAGVRRIEALTGEKAVRYLLDRSDIISQLEAVLKAPAEVLPARVSELQESLKDKEKTLKNISERMSLAKATEALKAVRSVNGVDVVSIKLDKVDMDTLRKAVDTIMNEMPQGGIVLAGTVSGDKVNFVCRVSREFQNKYKAGDLIREVAKVAGGSGGGRNDMAQAGGKEPEKIDEALEKIYSLI